MSLLHDAYTALLSGLTTKTGNEIHWQDERGLPITIEVLDISLEWYVINWHNTKLSMREEYKEGRLIKRLFRS